MALVNELEKQGNKLFKYRGTLPILVLLAAFALHAYQEYSKTNSFDNCFGQSESYKLICLGVSLLGLFVRVHTLGFVKPHTSGRNTCKQIAEGINTTGMYSLVRHPLYLGNFLMWLGVGLLTENITFNLFFILGFWLYYERIMYAEESFLLKKFGKKYADWSANVPPFIPKFSNYTKPELNFAWKKIIRQEKSGIAALFIVFMLFHQIEYYFEFNTIDLSLSLWNSLFIVFGVYIIVVKLIQNNTDWLCRKKTR